jgi:ribonuclease VapC
MAEVVVDASAVLAVALREQGWEAAEELLIGSLICAVNAAEVVSRYLAIGVSLAQTQAMLTRTRMIVEPLDPVRAVEVGALHRATRAHGLSIGDCACLALARSRGLPALTADRAWAGLDVGVDIQLIR